MELLLVNNEFGSGGMRVYGEQFVNSIKSLNKYIKITYYNKNIKYLEKFDYILHFGWNQFIDGDFKNADFKTIVSTNKNKNILFIFFDLDFLNKKYILDIKNNFNYIIYDSKFSFEKGNKYLGDIKSKVIQPGISEDSLFNYLYSERYIFLEDGKFNFLHINNTGYVKGIDILLKSFIKFLKNNSEARLILKINKKVFEYIYNNFEKDLNFLLKSKKIFIIDFEISQKDLFSLYKVSNCYVNTSINETFSLPTLEALFFGLDVISSFELGMKEFIKKRKGVYRLNGKFAKIGKNVWKNNFSGKGFFIDKNSLYFNLTLSFKNFSNKKIRFDIFEEYNFLKIGKKFLEIIL